MLISERTNEPESAWSSRGHCWTWTWFEPPPPPKTMMNLWDRNWSYYKTIKVRHYTSSDVGHPKHPRSIEESANLFYFSPLLAMTAIMFPWSVTGHRNRLRSDQMKKLLKWPSLLLVAPLHRGNQIGFGLPLLTNLFRGELSRGRVGCSASESGSLLAACLKWLSNLSYEFPFDSPNVTEHEHSAVMMLIVSRPIWM